MLYGILAGVALLVAAWLLAEKSFYGCDGLVVTDEMRVTIAAQACLLLLLLLNRPDHYYPRWSRVLGQECGALQPIFESARELLPQSAERLSCQRFQHRRCVHRAPCSRDVFRARPLPRPDRRAGLILRHRFAR